MFVSSPLALSVTLFGAGALRTDKTDSKHNIAQRNILSCRGSVATRRELIKQLMKMNVFLIYLFGTGILSQPRRRVLCGKVLCSPS